MHVNIEISFYYVIALITFRTRALAIQRTFLQLSISRYQTLFFASALLF